MDPLRHIRGECWIGNFVTNNQTGWQKLMSLSPQQSLAKVQEATSTGQPVCAFMSWLEYKHIYPEGLSKEQYGGMRRWAFEYNDGIWAPVRDMNKGKWMTFAEYNALFPGIFNQTTYADKYWYWNAQMADYCTFLKNFNGTGANYGVPAGGVKAGTCPKFSTTVNCSTLNSWPTYLTIPCPHDANFQLHVEFMDDGVTVSTIPQCQYGWKWTRFGLESDYSSESDFRRLWSINTGHPTDVETIGDEIELVPRIKTITVAGVENIDAVIGWYVK